MYTAMLQNNVTGVVIVLTGRESLWQIASIQGLAPAPALVNTSTVVGSDGVRLNSMRIEPRNVVITIKLNQPESARRTFEQLAAPKSNVRFWYSAGDRSVYIDGVVETFECDLFSAAEIVQISILCPDPYFKDRATQAVEIEPSTGGSIVSLSNIPTGIICRATFSAQASSFTLTNVNASKHITVDYAFDVGDILMIDTRLRHKAITLTRSGSTVNIFGSLQDGSELFTVRSGQVLLQYSATPVGQIRNPVDVCEVDYTEIYAGV